MGTRLYLHVGMPKTGTTYVQSVLHAGAEQLAEQGLTLLPATRRGSFRLSEAVRAGVPVPRFGKRLAAAPTPRVLTSDEMLGGATSDQIARLLEACGDTEVHLVLSVRSLSRLLPSTWQQRVQQRGESPPLEEFLAAVVGREGELAERWWTDRGVVPVLERWADHVPRERMHVVTVPGAGADPRSLLERHASVLGIDTSVLDEDSARPNPSLGWAQAEVLRQVKARVPREQLTREGYLPVGKRWLGARHLAAQQGEPPRMPSSLRAWWATSTTCARRTATSSTSRGWIPTRWPRRRSRRSPRSPSSGRASGAAGPAPRSGSRPAPACRGRSRRRPACRSARRPCGPCCR